MTILVPYGPAPGTRGSPSIASNVNSSASSITTCLIGSRPKLTGTPSRRAAHRPSAPSVLVSEVHLSGAHG